jgi:hypothetical protein
MGKFTFYSRYILFDIFKSCLWIMVLNFFNKKA